MRASNHRRDNNEHTTLRARQAKGLLGPTSPARRPDGSAHPDENANSGTGTQVNVDGQISADRQILRAPAPTRWRIGRRRASALISATALATALAATSLTACSLNAGGQAAPTTTSSQARETNDRQPTAESDEPTDEDSTEPSDSSNASYLCGGLVTEELLNEQLSFTPSKDNFSYTNRPPNDYSSGYTYCTLNNEADDMVTIRYDGESDFIQSELEDAETNADGDWQPLTIDGQDGKGWINPSRISDRALWVYPDGSNVQVRITTSRDTTITSDNLKALMEHLVAASPEHNKTVGDLSESRG